MISFAVTSRLVFPDAAHMLSALFLIIIIITLFQEDNIFGRVASLTYGPQLTNVGMIL